ncbi:putative bifunctional diguanylate cyclase/phosphodiesterase [Mycoplana ramosa]|uniref:Bifunctional diguanylate cyclase/phosphodiesterase n=1 Tax=Mycoplana ramosa TaxID=40837 RepID=A0ABW3YYN9_MYCRA
MSKATAAASDAERFFDCNRLGLPVVAFRHDGGVQYANEPAMQLAGPDQAAQRMFFDRLYRARRFPENASGIRRTGIIELGDGRTQAIWETLGNEHVVVTLTPWDEPGPEQGLFPLDELTGLCGRSELLSRLEAAAAEQRDDIVVYALDLDRFKFVNDTLGHPIGDALLKAVAKRLRGACRQDDLIARVGGDEFIIVQTNVRDVTEAIKLAERLVDLIGRTYLLSGHSMNVGVSVGIAFSGNDARTAERLLQNADLALYRAKNDGRGRYALFDPELHERMQRRRALEIDLRRALAFRQFALVYQPQVDLARNRVTGFEALIRWHHPERGVVSPLEFIPLAEEIGLITQIGEWCLRTACKDAAGWPDDLSVSVNVSPVQFRGGNLSEIVVSALGSSGLPAHRLELEITESALLNYTDEVLATLKAVKVLGVQVSMDDFGTGYSSLSYLQKFPFDKIKIDQSFIRGADSRLECQAVLRAVAGLGMSLGMKTIAEGVETEEQLERVRAEGCTSVQGYFTGRPIAEIDIDAFLSSWDRQRETGSE